MTTAKQQLLRRLAPKNWSGADRYLHVNERGRANVYRIKPIHKLGRRAPIATKNERARVLI